MECAWMQKRDGLQDFVQECVGAGGTVKPGDGRAGQRPAVAAILVLTQIANQHAFNSENLAVCHLLLRCRDRHRLIALRHDYPGDNVGDKAGKDAGHDTDDSPEQTHERDIQSQVLSQARAHPGNAAIVAGTNQFFLESSHADSGAAIGADSSVVGNCLTTLIAIHGCPPWKDTDARDKTFQCRSGYSLRYASFMYFLADSAGGVPLFAAITASYFFIARSR